MRAQVGSKFVWALVVLCVVSALFLGPTIDQYFLWNGEFERSLANFWNLGHLILFALAAVTTLWFGLPRKTVWIAGAFLVLFIVGLLIEFIQSKVGRSASIVDVAHNVIGLGFGFTVAFLSRSKIAWLILLLLIIVELLLLRPYFSDVLDEWDARESFPLLADFSSQRQSTRWVFSNSRGEIAMNRLAITFLPAEYSSTELRFFPADWSRYRQLHIGLHNTSEEAYLLRCRLHDRLHETNGLQFSDRFNADFYLPVGESVLSIELSDVQDAPETRMMDLQKMRSLLCFTHNINSPRTLEINKIWLSTTGRESSRYSASES